MVSMAAKIASLSPLSKIPAPTMMEGFLAFERVEQKG